MAPHLNGKVERSHRVDEQEFYQLLDRDGISDEVRQGYLELQLRFIKAIDENVALQLELNKVAETRSAHPNMPQGKPFLPGAQISPIQINVHGGTVEKSVNAEEEPCRK